MWISKLYSTNSRSHGAKIQNAMDSLSCLEPFQQLVVITTPTLLARKLISDEVIFCDFSKWLRGRSCIRFKIDLKGYYNQISNEAMFSIFQFCPHFLIFHKHFHHHVLTSWKLPSHFPEKGCQNWKIENIASLDIWFKYP